MKTQFVRLIDVFVMGPLLFALSQQKGELSQNERDLLAFFGVATIAYNMANYLIQLQTDRASGELATVDASDDAA